ncbi:MAG TPA: cupredoxin domain-containing protein [Solirubrobacterales bacterium]|nr:cupredoxin domain-containing protein [Solirubrobacterales bacterium]
MSRAAFGLALLLAALALVACGGSDDESTATTTGGSASAGGSGANAGPTFPKGGGPASEEVTIRFETDPGGDLAYTEDTVTSKTGNYDVELFNRQEISHDVAIEDPSGKTVGKTEVIGEGFDSVVVPLSKPGDYTFYCSVPGHREAGMEGTLKVK